MSFSLFGSSSTSGGDIYSLLTEYNNIKNGTYYKVVKQYYAKQASAAKSTANKSKDSSTANSTTENTANKAMTSLQGEAKELKASADALTKTGKDSLFTQKEITTTDEDGNETTTMGYDTDAIYSAVKNFVDDYNSVMGSASSSLSTKLQRQADYMKNATDNYKKKLEDIGISISSKGTLTLDEKKFKEADMNKVKDLFNGSSSWAASVSSRASTIDIFANSEANSGRTYTSGGGYNDTYSTGNFLNGLF